MRFLSFLSTAAVAVVTVTARASDGETVKSADLHIISPQQQKEAFNTTELPRAPLPWGKVNFIHTTDTHGWLDGHGNVPSWGGDWGDFVSFVKNMQDKAFQKKVDLLLIDSGDFHDGGGLSDSTNPKGSVSDSIFQNIDYDLVTVGNHGVRTVEEALNIHRNMSRVFGDRFLTSNVDVRVDGKPEPIGNRYRAFQTKNGLRIVAFGVTINDTLRDLKNTEVYSADYMFTQTWFAKAMNETADLYVIVGHAPVYSPCHNPKTDSPLVCLRDKIRNSTKTPIQIFGGHAHHRNFTCYDEKSSGIESGKYGDTVGWLALDEVPSTTWTGTTAPLAEPKPKKTCPGKQTDSQNPYLLDRRYLDWNRLTFAYHTVGLEDNSPSVPATFDTPLGRKVTDDISKARHLLNLTYFLGCAKEDYCFNCKKVGQDGNIYEVLKDALSDTVVKKERASIPRVVIANDGTIRDNIYQGPFTLGDAYAIVPFPNTFMYIAKMPCGYFKRMAAHEHVKPDISCPDGGNDFIIDEPPESHMELRSLPDDDHKRDILSSPEHSPGYTTHDGLGDDGDDTLHSPIDEDERYMKIFWGNASFPNPKHYPPYFDVVFTSYLETKILDALKATGAPYKEENVAPYLPSNYTSREVLPDYTARHWSQDRKHCPIRNPGDRY
ncbi:Metallo-dependent phosphatase-like protein [Aspergillus cavernicola]|uniref:Metallo-dependent phosphatase-like protein n=1 Tax=Aspergillus cavernicola TaxID=176166 RepID=A0ABR4IEH9_9EURO